MLVYPMFWCFVCCFYYDCVLQGSRWFFMCWWCL